MKYMSFLLLTILFFSCKSEKQAVTIPKNAELSFGSSGGFANARDEYVFGLDGKLYRRKNTTPKKILVEIGDKKANSLLHEALELGIDKLDSKHPGNMTYFIRYSDGNKTNEVNWGDPNNSPPGDIKDFYEKLNKLRP